MAWVRVLRREVEKVAQVYGGFPEEPSTMQANLPEVGSWYVGRLWNQRAGLRRLDAVLQSALEQRLEGR
eukprot:4282963-Pleurochrysis_carterae.AAC.1